ncbi:somatotropin [Etheostoma cragini]|uniref:somatotropin n=1 Tax=Etheostoma cragini TaxID=417921 RepID=UPI00155EF811|nr:somatotropin [Etheostoma cragini]
MHGPQQLLAVLLLSLLCVGVSSQPITEGQRLFSIAVSRVQHLHLLAQRLFSDFESSLQTEEQRQLNKIFLQDFCNSDYIISPIDKHETQRSSVLKLSSDWSEVLKLSSDWSEVLKLSSDWSEVLKLSCDWS